jgi:hypothetical protein
MYHMGIDQYGETYHGLTAPRKELLDLFGRKHAGKMYRDTKDGPRHVGYVIAGRWIELFEVTPWRRPC